MSPDEFLKIWLNQIKDAIDESSMPLEEKRRFFSQVEMLNINGEHHEEDVIGSNVCVDVADDSNGC